MKPTIKKCGQLIAANVKTEISKLIVRPKYKRARIFVSLFFKAVDENSEDVSLIVFDVRSVSGIEREKTKRRLVAGQGAAVIILQSTDREYRAPMSFDAISECSTKVIGFTIHQEKL